MTNILIFVVININAIYSYDINDYGWEPSSRSGIGIDNFAGGTRGPSYQYEQTYTIKSYKINTLNEFLFCKHTLEQNYILQLHYLFYLNHHHHKK